MKNQNNRLAPQLTQTNLSRSVAFASAFAGTMLITSSVVQASDLQIYANPTAGQKTIVMMLDTSGSMGGKDSGQTGTRLTGLKNGMNAFLDSNATELVGVKVALGHYSTNGDGKTGRILVPAATLGAVGSTQREALKTAVKNLKASGNTPTSHAYAEAAAYLMGSTPVTILNNAPIYFNFGGGNSKYWASCAEFNSAKTDCNIFTGTTTKVPDVSGMKSSSCTRHIKDQGSNWSGTCYSGNQFTALTGFNDSVSTSKDGSKYSSPLPAVDKRVSCDGQGVYVLSDGEANGSSPSESTMIMSAVLGSKGTGFSCPTSGGLNTGSYASWHCMGEFAKKLYDKTLNPAGVSIQTAFVGFGSDFNAMSQTHVQQACKLSSRTQADRTGDDKCSPGQGSYAVTSPGYGNGGFFTTQSAAGVTESVIAFINNLGKAPLEPLTTGAISVPVDNLSPSGLQPFGFLRALEPNPQSTELVWTGNLKKYQVLQTGNNAGAFAAAGGGLVYNKQGGFNTGNRDLWNNSSVYGGSGYADGGIVRLGGTYSKVPMPVKGQAENLNAQPPQYAYVANENSVRKLFTDVKSDGGAAMTAASNGASLLKVPGGTVPTTAAADYVLTQFKTQTTLKDFPVLAKIKLLNYLGYSIPYDETATTLPTKLEIPAAPHLSMGGSIHSLPVQLTYSGTMDANNNLTSTREQSVMYGTMDGGLHVVDSGTGAEKMVFVPSELLRDNKASKALIKGQTDTQTPLAGVDGMWVVDSTYKTQRGTGSENSSVNALKMNVYGGMRMGGNSYYGLNLLDIANPKMLFRIGPDVTGFTRMGQSWSKPVLANVRVNGVITRVMIVGGGYDQCYENPRFELGKTVSDTKDYPDTSCNNKPQAQGNAVYMVNAETGAIVWSASSSGAVAADGDQQYMKHSIVSRISAVDRDLDGLIDNLYFGDLGGQVFRADLDNNQTKTGSTYSKFGVRVTRIANLASNDSANSTWDYTGNKAPRFYEAPTLTFHSEAANNFLLVGLASGNRSTPLDVVPTVGREKLLPSTALNDRPVNNVYGIIDRDFAKSDLMKASTVMTTSSVTLNQFQKNPQTLTGKIGDYFFGAAGKNGWYRSLSSMWNGTERGGTSFRVAGGMKAYEEPFAITGNLIVPVYDPQGTGVAEQDPCKPRVVGETDRQLFCLPFGACLKTDGTVDGGTGGKETKTGFQTKTGKEWCPPNVTECNDNVIGSGIRGLAMAPIAGTNTACPDKTLAGNEKGTGRWSCEQLINPTRWYDKWIK